MVSRVFQERLLKKDTALARRNTLTLGPFFLFILVELFKLRTMENEEKIAIDDFAKIKIKIGKILSAEKVPDADKLIKFSIDVGEESPRQILSGIAMHYPDPAVLVGKHIPVIVNLAPRMIRGLESNGMVLYAVGEGEHFTTLEPAKEVPPGTPVK